MSAIKHVHFDGLRKIDSWHAYTEEEIEDYRKYHGKPLYDGDLEQAYVTNYNYYMYDKVQTYQELRELSEKKFKNNYVDHYKSGQIHLFVIVNWQLRTFQKFMEKYGYWKYKVFETDWAGNNNYPKRDPYLCMKAFIFHYKD